MRSFWVLLCISASCLAQSFDLQQISEQCLQLRSAGKSKDAESLLKTVWRQAASELSAADKVFLKLSLATIHGDQGELELSRIEYESVAADPHATSDDRAASHAGVLIARLRLGQADSAAVYIDRAVAPDWEQLQATASPATVSRLAAWLGLTEAKLKRERAAERYFRIARKHLDGNLQPSDIEGAIETLSVIAHGEVQRRRWGRARSALAEAIRIRRTQSGPETWLVVPQLLSLAELGRLSNQRDFELDNAREAWQLLQANAVQEPWVVQWTCQIYVEAAKRAGEREMLREAQKACSTPAPARPPVSVEFGALQK